MASLECNFDDRSFFSPNLWWNKPWCKAEIYVTRRNVAPRDCYHLDCLVDRTRPDNLRSNLNSLQHAASNHPVTATWEEPGDTMNLLSIIISRITWHFR